MAFLDNSGDIILDAVLTDIGRKRMARGDFRITKFTVGDDEIDYGLFNKNHPSGSAYYDLEILQTPILEAFTQPNANINYGLISYARQDLLYIPSAVINDKTFSPRIASKNIVNSVFFLADNTKTNTNGEPTATVMQKTNNVSNAEILVSGDGNGRVIMIETGINSTELAASSVNQATYITSVGLADNGFLVRYDNRFIQTVMGNTGGQFSNGTRQGATLQLQLQNRGDITQADYTKFGTTSNALFGGGTLYDFIDTTVYVQGLSSNANIQLPIRIIKLAQT